MPSSLGPSLRIKNGKMIRLDEKMAFYESFQKPNKSGYVAIGAGLPRTGTMSTRHALGILLEGKCHHMLESGHNAFLAIPEFGIIVA